MDALITRVVAEVLRQLDQHQDDEFLPPYMQPEPRRSVTITETITVTRTVKIDLPSVSEMEYRRLRSRHEPNS